jgi:sulfatase maturation enzyme AslB (radical SAM superfamily)
LGARDDRAHLCPYQFLAKAAEAACNLGCQYCLFLSKQNLYPARESPLMSEALLFPPLPACGERVGMRGGTDL